MKRIQIFFLFLLIYNINCAQPNLDWVQKIEGTGSFVSVYGPWADYLFPGSTIKADSRGHLVACGTVMAVPTNLQGIGTPFITPSIGGNDCFLASYNEDGSVDWGITLGSTSFDVPNGISIDANDNIFIWGYFQGAITLDPGIGSAVLTPTDGNRDIFIAKYDKNGNLLNYMQLVYNFFGTMSEYIYNMEVDGNGNLLVAGNYGTNIDLDPSPLVYTLPDIGGSYSKGFVAKYDANFEFMQAWTLRSASTFNVKILDFQMVDDNGFIMAGWFADTLDFDLGPGQTIEYSLDECGFVAKYDSLGQLIFVNRLNGPMYSQVQRITVTEEQNIILGGLFIGDIEFYLTSGDTLNFSGPSLGYYDHFIAEYNSSGQTIWSKHLPLSENYGQFNSLEYQPSDKMLFVAINFSGQLNLDYGGTEFTLTASAFTMSLSIFSEANGDFQQGYMLPSAGINYDFLDVRDGSLYIFGTFRNTLDLDFSTSISNVTTSNVPGVFISKYCLSGPNVSINGPDTIVACQGQILSFTASGSINYSWYDSPTSGTLISSNDTLIITADSSGYIYAEGLNGCPTIRFGIYINVISCTGIDDQLQLGSELHPKTNPVNSEIMIVGEAVQQEYILYTIDGRLVSKGIVNNYSIIDVAFLTEGIYFLRIDKKTFKIIKI